MRSEVYRHDGVELAEVDCAAAGGLAVHHGAEAAVELDVRGAVRGARLQLGASARVHALGGRRTRDGRRWGQGTGGARGREKETARPERGRPKKEEETSEQEAGKSTRRLRSAALCLLADTSAHKSEW